MARPLIIVTGDRTWCLDDQKEAVRSRLATHDAINTLFVLGDARGTDSLAHGYCVKERRCFLMEFAYWEIGRGAGPERNGRMLSHANSNTIVEAFHDQLHTSKGTLNCVKQALDLQLSVYVTNTYSVTTKVVRDGGKVKTL